MLASPATAITPDVVGTLGVVAGLPSLGVAVRARSPMDRALHLRGEAGMYARSEAPWDTYFDEHGIFVQQSFFEGGVTAAVGPNARVGGVLIADLVILGASEQKCGNGCRFNRSGQLGPLLYTGNVGLGAVWSRYRDDGAGFDIGLATQLMTVYDVGLPILHLDVDVRTAGGFAWGLSANRYSFGVQLGHRMGPASP